MHSWKIATFDSRRVVGKCLWLGDFSLPGNRFPGATRNRRSDSGGDTEKKVWAKSYQRLTLWWTNIINYGKPPFFMGKSTINVHFQQLFVCLPKTSTPLANGLRTASYSSVDAFTIDVLCSTDLIFLDCWNVPTVRWSKWYTDHNPDLFI
jgi:hypothetical protein